MSRLRHIWCSVHCGQLPSLKSAIHFEDFEFQNFYQKFDCAKWLLDK